MLAFLKGFVICIVAWEFIRVDKYILSALFVTRGNQNMNNIWATFMSQKKNILADSNLVFSAKNIVIAIDVVIIYFVNS